MKYVFTYNARLLTLQVERGIAPLLMKRVSYLKIIKDKSPKITIADGSHGKV